jgi:hypothetical protein
VADHVFSAARLRGYRVIEEAGLEDAVALQVLNTVLASHLWLPLSLIEIAFRNTADLAIAELHPRGADWLIDAGREGEVLVARHVVGPASFLSVRSDGAPDDPVAAAAMMASQQLDREEISRDDLIAHLMLGFWAVRAPHGLRTADGLDCFAQIASGLDAPFNEGTHLERVMVNHVLRTRNRVAHHEPLLFRAKHVFTRHGDPKTGADLVTSLESAIQKFLEEVEVTVDTARALAPMASGYLVSVPDVVRDDLAPLQTRLAGLREELKAARDTRRAERRASS